MLRYTRTCSAVHCPPPQIYRTPTCAERHRGPFHVVGLLAHTPDAFSHCRFILFMFLSHRARSGNSGMSPHASNAKRNSDGLSTAMALHQEVLSRQFVVVQEVVHMLMGVLRTLTIRQTLALYGQQLQQVCRKTSRSQAHSQD